MTPLLLFCHAHRDRPARTDPDEGASRCISAAPAALCRSATPPLRDGYDQHKQALCPPARPNAQRWCPLRTSDSGRQAHKPPPGVSCPRRGMAERALLCSGDSVGGRTGGAAA